MEKRSFIKLSLLLGTLGGNLLYLEKILDVSCVELVQEEGP